MNKKVQSKNALVFIFATVVLDTVGIGIIFPIMPDLLADLGYKNIAEPELDPQGFLSKTYGFFVCPPTPLQPLEEYDAL